MWAIRVPYPPKGIELSGLSIPGMPSTLKYVEPWTVDFPERHISYQIVGYKQADLPRFAEEVCKAVDRHARGEEPRLLEIRLADPQ